MKIPDKNKILNTAVIGLGRAGWDMHIPQIIENDKYELTSVVDPLQERLDEARNEIGVHGYKNCKELFENDKPDMVVIASPTHFHKEQAVTAFENGCNVLCDKPMTTSLEDADRMIESMKANKRKLMVYMPHRCYADAIALREIIKMNLIGKVYMIKRGWSRYRIRVDWQALSKYGGGELNNSGAHFIDQLLYLSGSTIRNYNSSLRKIISRGDTEDVAKIVIEMHNGMILDLDINMAAAYPVTPWHVLGEWGSIIWDENSKSWKVRYYLEEELNGVELQNNLAADNRSYCDDQNIPWREMTFPVSGFRPINFYDKCYEYFVLNKEPFVPIKDTREVMRIIEMCKKNSDNL